MSSLTAEIINKKDEFFACVESIHDEEQLRIKADEHFAYMQTAFDWIHYTFDDIYTAQERIQCIKTIYEREFFYSSLNTIMMLEDQIEFFMNSNYDIIADTQPEATLSLFDVINTEEDANKVADAFMAKYGKIIICIEASYSRNTLMTIMDCIDLEYKTEIGIIANNIHLIDLEEEMTDELRSEILDSIEESIESIKRIKFIQCAFMNRGFSHASECNPRHLIILCAEQNLIVQDFTIDYDYSQIKKENAWIQEELIMNLLHPRRVDAWIRGGGDVEDYLL